MKIFYFLKDLFFKRKTITYSLWTVIITIIAELQLIGNTAAIIALLNQISEDSNNTLIKYALLVISITINEGSFYVLFVLIMILFLLAFLRYKEITHEQIYSKGKDKAILNKVKHQIIQKKRIGAEDYIEACSIIEDASIKDKIIQYHNFQRKRGNIHLLEKFVSDENLVKDLQHLIDRNELLRIN